MIALNADSLLAFPAFVAACFLAGVTGVVFRPGAWYRRLSKPSWRPPDWLFAPVWSALYLTIAVAGWLAWREAGWSPALAVYAVQLALNAAWTPLFFGLHRPGLALIDLVLLWCAVAATIALFLPLHAGAAWLLVPYLGWVSFAVALNAAIWRRNRRGGGGGAAAAVPSP